MGRIKIRNIVFFTICTCISLMFIFTYESNKREKCLAVQKTHVNEYELQKGLETGDAIAQSMMGDLYSKAGRYEQSAIWYQKSAEQGYPVAQFNLGIAYEQGKGVAKSLDNARYWYYKASMQNFSNAQVNLGLSYLLKDEKNTDIEKSRYWLNLAAKQSNTIALYSLGKMYADGIGVKKDNKEAVVFFQKAVKLGSMSAKNSLALFYGKGLGGLSQNSTVALSLIKSSACQGYAIAQNNLGLLYSQGGNEIKRDLKMSYAWYSVAYFNGVQSSLLSKNEISKKMNAKDLSEAEAMGLEYIGKYDSPKGEDDTYRSTSECKYP